MAVSGAGTAVLMRCSPRASDSPLCTFRTTKWAIRGRCVADWPQVKAIRLSGRHCFALLHSGAVYRAHVDVGCVVDKLSTHQHRRTSASWWCRPVPAPVLCCWRITL